jgi:hypothetical protein
MEGITIVTYTSAEKVIIKKEVNDTPSVDRRSQSLGDNKSTGIYFCYCVMYSYDSINLKKRVTAINFACCYLCLFVTPPKMYTPMKPLKRS